MSKPLRVLQVLGRMDRGGAETMIMNYYRHIEREKVQFEFVVHTNDKCAYDHEIEELGGSIYHVPKFSPLNAISYCFWWMRFFPSHPEYRIIHAHVRSTASIFLLIAKINGLFTIAHSHSTTSKRDGLATVKDILQLPIRYIADKCFACSDAAGKWLFGNHKAFEIVPNAIDLSKFTFDDEIRKQYRKTLGVSNNFVIGHVGSFTDPKNHFQLIDIFANIVQQRNNAKLILVGSGVLEEQIKAKIDEHGIGDSVIMLGSRDDVSSLMQAMDVFVFPSLYEGLGIVVIEAQATGLPCIVSSEVPMEVKKTDIVHFVPLSEKPEVWAKKILETSKDYVRLDYTEEIRTAGYDIALQAVKLQEMYFKYWRNVCQ